MKKTIILLAFVSCASIAFSQYSHRGFLYLGWQVSNNHISNAYYTLDASNNYTFYNDGFFYNYDDWRIGLYNGNNVGEIDLSGAAYSLVAIFTEFIYDKPFREDIGKLRQLPKNLPGYEGTGVDWYVMQADWAFGGEKLFIGPYVGVGTLKINEIHPGGDLEVDFQSSGIASFKSVGLASYYFYDNAIFYDPMKFKLISSFFWDKNNKVSGLYFTPEVTIMPLKFLAFTVYYRLQTADLSKSELDNSEFLPRQTISTIGIKLALAIRMN